MAQKSNKLGFLLAFLALSTFFVLNAGCGPRKIPVVKISGKVTYKGEPLKFGVVYLVPKGAGAKMPTGLIQPDGSFEMGTYTQNDGGPEGEYFVRVVCMTTQDPSYVPPVDTEPTPGKSLIPEKYSEPNGDGRTVSVVKKMPPLEIVLE